MTGKDEPTPTPEGLNTLSVRQSSDIFASNCCRKENELRDREERRGGLQAVGMGYRNCEHRMTAGGRGNTLASEEKSGGRQWEVRQMGYLTASGKKAIGSKSEDNNLQKNPSSRLGVVFL
jgi:hypothetical protein